jgi:hypothetical protein
VAKKLPITAKSTKPPSKAQRDQAASRREAKANGIPLDEAALSPFVAVFCEEYVRIGILSDAHRMAERRCREPLDLSGFRVEYKDDVVPNKGKITERVVRTRKIIDPVNGYEVQEDEIRSARAADLYSLPEVKARIKALRKQIADQIDITAQSLAQKSALVFRHAIAAGEYQVAANLIALEGKLFGVEAGSGGDAAGVPVQSVNINIRDFSGKKKAS